VGDVFSYKNRLVMKVVYRSVLQNVHFTRYGLLTLNLNERKGMRKGGSMVEGRDGGLKKLVGSNESNKSEDEEEEESEDDEEDDEEDLDDFIKNNKKANISTGSLKLP
jgi:hypothetical protein